VTSPPRLPAWADEPESLRRQLHDLVEFLPDALVEGRLEPPTVTYMNRMALALFGYTEHDASAGAIEVEQLFADGEYEKARELVRQAIAEGMRQGPPYRRTGRQTLFELRLHRRDGSEFCGELQGSFVLDAGGLPSGLRLIVRDISERKALERRLEELSVRDPLTGCYNRRFLAQERAELERPTARWGIVVFDLDDFKSVNDAYGHEEGDRVLIGFSHFINRHSRPEDIWVRLGGDEFGLFVHADSEAELDILARRLVEAAPRGCPAPFSMGIAFRHPGEPLEAVIKRADARMYAAKGGSPARTRKRSGWRGSRG
jgi:diguanylate cyclase (GGDEF)-like protein/PAS domain S-box-containing protein